jgi:hypothetical protein
MCKRIVSRLKLFLLVVSVTFTLLNCKRKNTNEKLNEIHKLSEIEIPKNSKLLNYYDNDEFQIVFEIVFQKKELRKLIKKYNFKKIQFNELKFSKTSSDSFIIKEIENGFIPPINIEIDNNSFLIYKKFNSWILLDSKKCILYGLINY